MHRRARMALAGAAVGIGLLSLTWYSVLHIGFVGRADERIFSGFGALTAHPHVSSLAHFVAGLCNPSPFIYFAAIPVAIALWRRRPRLALTVGGVLLGANVTTHLLKPLLAEPHAASLVGLAAAPAAGSWPSGHATASMSLTLSLVIASSPRWRPRVAALGAIFTVAVVYSFLALGWHWPSDVLGGFLVATTWALAGIAAMYADQARHRRAASAPAVQPATWRALEPAAATLLGASVLIVLAVLLRPEAIVSYARLHHALVFGAAAIGGLALVLATGVMLALRRPGPLDP